MVTFTGRTYFALSAICLVSITGLGAILFTPEDAEARLALVTANTLITNSYVWNMITAVFFEPRPLRLLLDLLLLWPLTPLADGEPVDQLGLYLTFATLACTTGMSMLCFVRFITWGSDRPLIHPTHGFSGVLMAWLMLARWKRRDQPIWPGVVPEVITYHNLPALMLAVQIVSRVVGFSFLSADIYFSLFSILFSWSYLRFYYSFPDPSEYTPYLAELSFVNMFPKSFGVVLVPFTTAFYNLLAVIGIFPPLSMSDRRVYHHLNRVPVTMDPESNSTPKTDEGDKPAPTVDIVAERRKQKAMQLLGAKMAELGKDRSSTSFKV